MAEKFFPPFPWLRRRVKMRAAEEECCLALDYFLTSHGIVYPGHPQTQKTRLENVPLCEFPQSFLMHFEHDKAALKSKIYCFFFYEGKKKTRGGACASRIRE